MTPEGRVKAKVKTALDKLGDDCWRFMPVQNGYGSVALDFLLAIRGRFVAIETKAPGKKLTPLQEGTKAQIEAAGGIVLVVWDESSLEIAMKIILALEFAPNAPLHLPEAIGGCLDACFQTADTRRHVCAYRCGTEEEREAEQQLRALDASHAADPAAGWDHGPSGEPPKGRLKPDPRRAN